MNNLRGAKIIYQESKATQPSHLYFLQKDSNYCEVIVDGRKEVIKSSKIYATPSRSDSLTEDQLALLVKE